MKKTRAMKTSRGFSLIELFIVVGLIGAISMFAFGYYTDSVIASNRTEARSTLSEAAGALEKCRSLYGAYNSGNCTVAFPMLSETNLYAVTVTAIAAETFTLQADPIPGSSQANDADCTRLSLTNTGLKTATGGDPTQCW